MRVGPRTRRPGLHLTLSVCLRTHSAGVAVGAVDLGQVSDVDRMLEGGRCRGGDTGRAFGLGHQSVALVAVPAHNLAISAHVLAVVTPKAAAEVKVSHVVGVSLPVELHFGEGSALENLPYFGDSVANFQLLRFRHVRIFVLVETLHAGGDALHGSVGRGVSAGENRDRLLLDEGEGNVEAPGQ